MFSAQEDFHSGSSPVNIARTTLRGWHPGILATSVLELHPLARQRTDDDRKGGVPSRVMSINGERDSNTLASILTLLSVACCVCVRPLF